MKKSLLFLIALFWSAWTFGQTVTFIAGSPITPQAFTDGLGSAARFNQITGIASDGTDIYVADRFNHAIRKVTPGGTVTTVAGTGTAGTADGTGTSASFSQPTGITFDNAGGVAVLYVTDAGSHKIRKVVISTGVVTTVAGPATSGSGTADGASTVARFNAPSGIVSDGTNLYVADTNNHRIRQIVISSSVTSTLAGPTGAAASGSANGTGTAASFNAPIGITLKGSTLYVADSANNMIRLVTTAGVVTTFAGSTTAGSTDGVGTAATFTTPTGIVINTSNLIYVSERASTANYIRSIDAATANVKLYAGITTSANVPTGSNTATLTAARFSRPWGLALDSTGDLYIGENFNHLVKKIAGATLSTTNFAVANAVTIYPNPASALVTVEVGALTNASLAVYDVLGRLVLSQKINTAPTSVNLESIPAGMYLFKISATEGVVTKTIVKQ